ncbi:MAG: adenylate cyclase [Parcubacteria group bacterium Gr01-1014_18]|nr:MAG: adenylate cyclase [Parcubacteria group bacterium Greene0416_36]TSC79768.1 MAG: adenylate cyclase [Parcubacteria group bacterium Gr01-1014_18]TSC97970.1 MAG: adenylate cyclase [Parcubacteria group bacterium Greene1014_20]TSD06599.1 MAG: adenylate cyclase [Parcubacteria group bacterium Greene0714_2]
MILSNHMLFSKKILNKALFFIPLQIIALSLLGYLVAAGHLFYSIENRIMDFHYIGYTPHSDIVIVAIDNPSLQKIGRWPWDRSKIAELIGVIQEQSPKAIGVDIAFPEPQNDRADSALASAIGENNNVILPIEAELYSKPGSPLLAARSLLSPIPHLASNAWSSGIVNTPLDGDGIFRKIPLSIQDPSGNILENFSAKIIRKYLDIPNNENTQKTSQHYRLADFLIPTDELSRMWVNFSGPRGTYKMISASDFVEGKIEPGILSGKIVLVGATAPDLHDEQLAPLSKGVPLSGVELHANTIQTILERKFLTPLSSGQLWILCLALAGFWTWIFFHTRVLLSSTLAVIFATSAMVASFLFFENGILFPLLAALIILVLSYFGALLWRYFQTRDQKRLIKKLFENYVDPQIVAQILDHPDSVKLGGEKKEVTIFFSDIRGFTAISEKMEPETLMNYLNEYLSIMTDIVIKNKGIVDKFIGDAIMAFWNAPLDLTDHPQWAAKTTQDMSAALVDFNRKWTAQGYPPVDIGIGLNTGAAIVGNVGSSNRFDYTLIGDSVNLASRVEGLNKEYGTQILVTESTYTKIKAQFLCRYVDLVAVKGKTKGVSLYEILNKPYTPQYLKLYQEAVQNYKERRFNQAALEFEKLSKMENADTVVAKYIVRCREYIKNPPPGDWTGIWEMKHK